MKTLLLLIIYSIFLISCSESNGDIPVSIIEKEKYTKKTTYTDWKEGKKTKLIEGNFFNEEESSRVHIEYFMDSIVRVSIDKLDKGNWLQCFVDSLPMKYYVCDSLIDLNGDGTLELVFQTISGMGNITDYHCSIYTMNKEKVSKLAETETMLNISFLTADKSFTTLEKSESMKIGRKYSWNRDLTFKLTQEQIITCDEEGGCVKKYFTLEKGKRKLVKQIKSDLIDNEFWGFQYWCD
jgi:hypothetical protein